MSELGPKSAEQEPRFSVANAKEFLGWMYKDKSVGKIDQITSEYLAEMLSILAQTAEERLNQGKEKRYKKSYKGPIELMVRWADGQSYHKISEYTGKSEGTVRIALASFAEKLGKLYNLDELISQTEISLQQKAEAMAAQAETMKQQIIAEELAAAQPAEPEAEPSEEILEIPPAPSCEEVAQLAIQKTVEVTDVEEPIAETQPVEEPEEPEPEEPEPEEPEPEEPEPEEPHLNEPQEQEPEPETEEPEPEPELMDPKKLERLMEDYPMFAKMKPEEIARVVRDLRLT